MKRNPLSVIRLASVLIAFLASLSTVFSEPLAKPDRLPDEVRAQQIRDLRWGMFVCWSFSTFSGREWTPTQDKDASYFKWTARR